MWSFNLHDNVVYYLGLWDSVLTGVKMLLWLLALGSELLCDMSGAFYS